MKHLTLILGGCCSGKSKFALERGQSQCPLDLPKPRKYYLATAQALDEEMASRINAQKKQRSADWITLEESIKVPDAFSFLNKRADVVVIDCVTLWLSHLLMIKSDYDILTEAEILIAAIKRVDFSVIVVSSEIGCGIVPADSISRLFADTHGLMHQTLASLADEVYFMVAGIPMQVKGGKA
ncbi:MAG: bifunctional adenosylcobinamide kinase/adenosylcobinamide-phosphate guanylyltransferase [Nitrospirae bacterium]|nr:bifunctional adenosylcobinamide kinase/adenosylcobinamide-phosphate guanylyltransferase [Candidatus Troglogloeales bacterium]MBI3598062.1 bifunctional adenosylcobinamide kinase/adenosylcobinamide-phosphate guanylyltransferase [Candidatus Troglogloeales bacterium]